jgi:hypothetical protein
MHITKLLLTLGVLIMAGSIAYAMVVGDFFAEAAVLFRYPWFHLSMIDLYVGFLLVAGWILFRERSRLTAIVWVVLVLALGNLASCLYALLVAIRSRGDWRWFWMGHRVSNDVR